MCGYDFSKLDNFTYEDAQNWYERIINHPCKWIIEFKGNFVGVASLRPYSENNKAKFSIELYAEKIYNLGIGIKVTEMVLNYGFKTLGYNKIYLRVLDYNTRAIKCYEKCGFIKEGIDREGVLINGTYHSDIYMGIIKPYSSFLVK